MLQEALEPKLRDTEVVEDESRSDQDEVAIAEFDLHSFLIQLRDETDVLLGDQEEVEVLVKKLKKENIRAESIITIAVFVLLIMNVFVLVNHLIDSKTLAERFIYFAGSAAMLFFTVHFAEMSEALNNYMLQYEKHAEDKLFDTRLVLYFELARGIDDSSLQEIIRAWRNTYSDTSQYVVTGETIAIARILAANYSRLVNLVSAEELAGIDSWSTRQLAE